MLPLLRKAAGAILEVYEDESLFHTEYKADRSPLTEADKRSNRIICDALEEWYPDIPIISEENQQASWEVRSAYERFFLVDPLDGTKEFIKRNGEFTINVAYLEDQRPVRGYVFVPVLQKAYIGERFEGAWSVDEQNIVTPLQAAVFHIMDEGIHVVASRSHRDPFTNDIINRLNRPQIVSIGSALKFIKVAEGEAHFYPRMAPTMEWDTAAAQCILEEAGGSVIRFDNRLPVTYNKKELQSPWFIAMGKILDPEILDFILKEMPG
ncbi:MAG TPA: 3'(2'),5'-bisphosphate nucleotidase CysQ [Saprospiraceae bacterium]|nr:3'(2'),5'-bisphosphate nucleotidase CysQ [Saprospiraceae bacterium]